MIRLATGRPRLVWPRSGRLRATKSREVPRHMKSSRAIWNPTKDFWESLRRDNPLGVFGEDLKSLAFGSWFTSFCHVLPTYRVDYHAGKSIESVVHCLDISISITICVSNMNIMLRQSPSLMARSPLRSLSNYNGDNSQQIWHKKILTTQVNLYFFTVMTFKLTCPLWYKLLHTCSVSPWI